jgi:hypothetical protein
MMVSSTGGLWKPPSVNSGPDNGMQPGPPS